MKKKVNETSEKIPEWVHTDSSGGVRTDLKTLLQSEQGQETLRQMEELRAKLAQQGKR
jgi:hypothetical protein